MTAQLNNLECPIEGVRRQRRHCLPTTLPTMKVNGWKNIVNVLCNSRFEGYTWFARLIEAQLIHSSIVGWLLVWLVGIIVQDTMFS